MSAASARRLIDAAFASIDALRALVRREPELLEARTEHLDETALHYLAVENQLLAVAALADAGAEVNTLNSCGGTPLSEAASLGYGEMVEYLLSRGARVQVPGQAEPTLHNAVRSANLRVVELLLSAGAAVDAQNDMEEAALHVAAEDDARLSILELLIKSGANTSVECFGETAFDIAVRWNAVRSAAVLAPLRSRGGADAA